MAGKIIWEPSRTLHEFRLLPGFTTDGCTPDRVDLVTRVATHPEGRREVRLCVPVVAAAMQAVSGPVLALELARLGGAAFIYCSQAVADQAAMVATVRRGLDASSGTWAAGTGPAPRGADAVCGVSAGDRSGGSCPRGLCAAAVNTHDFAERVPALAEAGVELLAVDSSDGHSAFQGRCLAWVRQHYPDLPVIGGNVITGDGFDYLAGAGAWGVKVGMGSGSICITQEQKGTGRGLATAVLDVVAARDRHFEATGRHLPVIADGGIGSAREIAIALALGADAVMMGRFFAGLEESPSEMVVENGRKMKRYWGEGAARAREWREARYKQSVFEEGVEGLVPYAGKLESKLFELCAMLRATLSTCGAPDIAELRRNAVVELVSALSIREGQVHGIEQPGSTDAPAGDRPVTPGIPGPTGAVGGR